MSGHFHKFAIAGLIVAGVAAAASFAIGGAEADQGAALAAGAILAAGDIAGALWIAGGQGRSRDGLAWARLGLIAAALGFLVLPWLASAQAPVRDGNWEITTRMDMPGMAGIARGMLIDQPVGVVVERLGDCQHARRTGRVRCD